MPPVPSRRRERQDLAGDGQVGRSRCTGVVRATGRRYPGARLWWLGAGPDATDGADHRRLRLGRRCRRAGRPEDLRGPPGARHVRPDRGDGAEHGRGARRRGPGAGVRAAAGRDGPGRLRGAAASRPACWPPRRSSARWRGLAAAGLLPQLVVDPVLVSSSGHRADGARRRRRLPGAAPPPRGGRHAEPARGGRARATPTSNPSAASTPASPWPSRSGRPAPATSW